jgi:hypothetical protein
LIDGYNRYGICSKHDIPFKTVEREFDSIDDACIWIIRNQFGRRNLVPYVRAELALKLEERLSKKGLENKSIAAKQNIEKRQYDELANSVNHVLPKLAKPDLDSSPKIDKIDTREEISKVSGISHGNIDKVKKIVEKAPEEVKQKLRSGDISINQAHKVVSMVQNDDKKDEILKKAIEKIEELRCPRLKSWE